jgi:glycine cleavage system H protein
MSDVPSGLRYSTEHEWVKVEGNLARVGVTAYAQDQLGDIVYVELPKVGANVVAKNTIGVVESVKAASDVYSPVTGTVKETNGKLLDQPELMNSDPYGEGWVAVVELTDPAEIDGLLDPNQYRALLDSQSE